MQATKEEGAYANGRVHVELLPAEVYGGGCEKQFSLRRLEAVLSEAEQQEHMQREMLKVGRDTEGFGMGLPPPPWCHVACGWPAACTDFWSELPAPPWIFALAHESAAVSLDHCRPQVPSTLRIEPMRFTTGQTLEFAAGAGALC